MRWNERRRKKKQSQWNRNQLSHVNANEILSFLNRFDWIEINLKCSTCLKPNEVEPIRFDFFHIQNTHNDAQHTQPTLETQTINGSHSKANKITANKCEPVNGVWDEKKKLAKTFIQGH